MMGTATSVGRGSRKSQDLDQGSSVSTPERSIRPQAAPSRFLVCYENPL